MIWDSSIWKRELINEYSSFEKYLLDISSDEYNSDHFVLGLEKFYFVCSFIIRKLIESKKLSDKIEKKSYKCTKYKRINEESVLDFLSSHKFNNFYDLSNPENHIFKINNICNLFIHSFVFFPTFDEEKGMKFIGVFANSDYSKEHCIYHIDYDEFVSMIQDVINDEIIYFELDRQTGKIQK